MSFLPPLEMRPFSRLPSTQVSPPARSYPCRNAPLSTLAGQLQD